MICAEQPGAEKLGKMFGQFRKNFVGKLWGRQHNKRWWCRGPPGIKLKNCVFGLRFGFSPVWMLSPMYLDITSGCCQFECWVTPGISSLFRILWPRYRIWEMAKAEIMTLASNFQHDQILSVSVQYQLTLLGSLHTKCLFDMCTGKQQKINLQINIIKSVQCQWLPPKAPLWKMR